MEITSLIMTASLTAIGAGIGAAVFNFFTKSIKHKNDIVLNRLDQIADNLQILLRYNLMQSAVISTLLDAFKTNHFNGNIERAEDILNEGDKELNEAMQAQVAQFLKGGR